MLPGTVGVEHPIPPEPLRLMLTPLQQQKLTRYFRVYDVDDDGRIARADYERVAENVRALHRAEERSARHRAIEDGFLRQWEALRASADADDDGGVDLLEWLRYWEDVLADDARYRDEISGLTERLFELFDTDGDGVLEADEFCNFYGIYGLKAALARKVFLDLDADGDGVATRQELIDMAHEFYSGDDPETPGNRLFGPLD
jgi:Ca2+-binding EF-hand superfamily protein